MESVPVCRLDEHLAGAKQHGAGTAACVSHAATEIGQVFIGIHHVTFYGLPGRLIVPTVVERHPLAAELLRALYVAPTKASLR